MESKARKYLTIIALGLAGGSIYFIPYVICVLRCTDCGNGNQQYTVWFITDYVYDWKYGSLYSGRISGR